MSFGSYEAFLNPTPLKRAVVFILGYAFYLVLMILLAVGPGILLGAIQRYMVVIVIFLINFVIIYKYHPLKRILFAVMIESLFGIVLALVIKILIGFKLKYPGLPIGTLFFFYEKMFTRLFFLLLVQCLKSNIEVKNFIVNNTMNVKCLSVAVLFIDVIFQDTLLFQIGYYVCFLANMMY